MRRIHRSILNPCYPLVGVMILPVSGLADATSTAATSSKDLQQRIAYHSFRLALENLLTGDPATTRGLLEKAVAGAPESIEARFVLAFFYDRKNEAKKATEQYREILRLRPGDLFATLAIEETGPLAGREQEASLQPPHPSSELLRACEEQLVNLVNADRTARSLKPLEVNPLLAVVARKHSEEMRDKNYFSHESPTPRLLTPRDRYHREFARVPQIIAENVSRRWSALEYSLNATNIGIAHSDLMSSSHHRGNILHPHVTQIGIGLAVNERGDFWITELFAKP